VTGAAENADSFHSVILNLNVEAEMDGAEVAPDTRHVHTPVMTLKNAALLALIGTILMTALLAWSFVFTFLNVLRGVVPAVTLFSSFIYAFGCFSVAVFFYLFHRAQ
jgi:ABC-type proline/glycine betaine transport system permease subunit